MADKKVQKMQMYHTTCSDCGARVSILVSEDWDEQGTVLCKRCTE